MGRTGGVGCAACTHTCCDVTLRPASPAGTLGGKSVSERKTRLATGCGILFFLVREIEWSNGCEAVLSRFSLYTRAAVAMSGSSRLRRAKNSRQQKRVSLVSEHACGVFCKHGVQQTVEKKSKIHHNRVFFESADVTILVSVPSFVQRCLT